MYSSGPERALRAKASPGEEDGTSLSAAATGSTLAYGSTGRAARTIPTGPESTLAVVRAAEAERVVVRRKELALFSTLTPAVITHLKSVAERSPWRQDNVFAKTGGSSVESRAFLYCFRGNEVNLDRQAAALTPTLEYFLSGNAAGRSPFNRQSMAAHVGWSLRHGMSGNPPRIVHEVDSIGARYALILFGGNDVQARNDRTYAARLLSVIDLLLAKGVIPVLGATLPRNDDTKMDYWAQRYNQWGRAIAEIRQIPFVDYYSALTPLPRRGLASDGVHPNILLEDGRGFACDFTEYGLQWGHNVRNLMTLQMLDRLRTALNGTTPLETTPLETTPLEAPAPVLRGEGTAEAPFIVRDLPFVDHGESTDLGSGTLNGYRCDRRGTNARNAERVYRLELDEELDLRMSALGRQHNGPDTPRFYLLGPDLEPAQCLRGGLPELHATLTPGVWHIVVEMGAKPGPFSVLIDVEPVEPPPVAPRARRAHRPTRRSVRAAEVAPPTPAH